MAVLPIAKLGNPVLRKIADRVDPREIRTKEFQQLIDDMFETMLEEPGIGLAAPQVSKSVQLVVMGCEGEGGFPTTTLINPTITGTTIGISEGRIISRCAAAVTIATVCA